MAQISLNSLMEPQSSARNGLSRRVGAIPLRTQLESVLSSGEEVVLDFGGVEATQSFVDELVGVIIVQQGPSVLKQIKFRRCSETMKSIVQFVVSDRTNQFIEKLGQQMALDPH